MSLQSEEAFRDGKLAGRPVDAMEQFVEQAAEGTDLDALKCASERDFMGWIRGGGTEIAKDGAALGVPEDVMSVEISVHDPARVKVTDGGGDICGERDG